MAIIECPGCRSPISEHAEKCLKCGALVAGKPGMMPSAKALSLLLAGLVVGYFAGREHLKWEMRQIVKGVTESIQEGTKGVSDMFPGGGLSSAAVEANREERDYLQQVRVQGISLGEGELGGDALFGEVKNLGQKELKEVEITIYYMGRHGKPVFEKKYRPVLVGQFSFGDEALPLKPGYSRKFGVKLSDAPSDWARKVKVAVTGVRIVGGS